MNVQLPIDLLQAVTSTVYKRPNATVVVCSYEEAFDCIHGLKDSKRILVFTESSPEDFVRCLNLYITMRRLNPTKFYVSQIDFDGKELDIFHMSTCPEAIENLYPDTAIFVYSEDI